MQNLYRSQSLYSRSINNENNEFVSILKNNYNIPLVINQFNMNRKKAELRVECIDTRDPRPVPLEFRSPLSSANLMLTVD